MNKSLVLAVGVCIVLLSVAVLASPTQDQMAPRSRGASVRRRLTVSLAKCDMKSDAALLWSIRQPGVFRLT